MFLKWFQMIHPKHNQNRLSVVKYLGEMYNFKVIESHVIFKTLYSFITFETSLDGTLSCFLFSENIYY